MNREENSRENESASEAKKSGRRTTFRSLSKNRYPWLL